MSLVHTFYDDADHTGKFKKYGSEHNEHESDDSDWERGALKQSGHEIDHRGKNGHTLKGQHDQSHQGYKTDNGREVYQVHKSKFINKNGTKDQTAHDL